MARHELLESAEFRKYQEELLDRLKDRYRELHVLISSPSITLDAAKNNLLKIEFVKGCISELEQIISLPSRSIRDEAKRLREENKNSASFLTRLKSVFGRKEVAATRRG